MNSLVRRIVIAASGAALTLTVLSGCGAINAAVDCATAADTMTEVAGNVDKDVETLQASTTKLRDQAADIEDAGLKQSALDFADEAEAINAAINGDLSKGSETDPSALSSSLETFTSECNALG